MKEWAWEALLIRLSGIAATTAGLPFKIKAFAKEAMVCGTPAIAIDLLDKFFSWKPKQMLRFLFFVTSLL
jgi:hypothetical protein